MGDSWKEYIVGDLGRVVTGKTPPTADPENYGGVLPFITPSDMKGQRYIDITERTISVKGSKHVRNLLIPPKTVFVSCIGSDMGKVGMTKVEAVTNQQINSIIVEDGIEPDYIYYNLFSRKEELQRLATSGSAQPILNKGHFSQLRISLPPLPEQKAIASILGALDDKIELNRKMNETLEAMARAIFKSWFVDFDPVHRKRRGEAVPRPSEKEIMPHSQQKGDSPNRPYMTLEILSLFPDSFIDSPLRKIPKGWKTGTIGEICENNRRGVNPEDLKPSTPYIGLEHMPRKNIALSEWGIADNVVSNKFFFKKGDILFGKLRPYFHKVGVAAIDGVCSTDILVINSKTLEWYGLALSHLSSDDFVNYADGTSTGTKMPRTNWIDMARFQIVIPPESIAGRFTDTVLPLVQAIQSNIHESRILAMVRDALLPKLLSGEIRVNPDICEALSNA